MGVYGKASKQANRFLFKLLHNKLVFFSRAFRMCAIIYGVWGWVGVRKDIDRIDLWDRELDFTMVGLEWVYQINTTAGTHVEDNQDYYSF